MESTAAPTLVLRVEVDCDPTVNFATQQNDVPIVKQIRVTNPGSAAIEGVRVRVLGEPPFFPAWETRIAAIPAGATHTLGPIDLRPSAEYLMGITERLRGTLCVEAALTEPARQGEAVTPDAMDASGVTNSAESPPSPVHPSPPATPITPAEPAADTRASANAAPSESARPDSKSHTSVTSADAAVSSGSAVLARASHPIDILAFDEWSGLSRALPEILAAFVLPNHPAIEGLLSDAAAWLKDKTGDSSLSGYQLKSPRRVGQIAQAIYAAVQARSLSYCNPPASFEQGGQKIRLPHRIFESRLATCLDLAVLFAACLEQAGLNPLVIITEGHAFAGVWTSDECFADGATDEALRIRKRVDLNEILVFETTLVTAPPPNDFQVAIAAAKRHLADVSQFHCALDIHRCRKSRIRPLPVRRAGETAAAELTSGQVSIGPDVVFDLDTGPALVNEAAVQKETAATRLDRWKRKLLDLTMHNRLLNFRQTKKTVQLLCPELHSLEDALADGLEFKILPRPADLEPENPRSSELHLARTGKDAFDELLREEFAERRLYANLNDENLKRSLTETYRAARTSMEEGGASALYLALGFLQWYQSDASEQPRLAPLILVPVELSRHSVQEGFRFSQSDEEPRINITLLELLKKDFGLAVPGMDPIPQDEKGINVRRILTTFRQAVKDTPRWDVVEDAQIGFFSFTKFLMWRDLEERSGDLLRNKVVDHLINRPTEPYPDDREFPNEEKLDETHAPNATFCPMPSDSSQLAAVYAAAEGRSYVLFGPPGTGKSQTITNLIAHSLANGKSVLFVSEKMAALNVVFNRLTSCGLGPFCLELHSNKTHKRHVIEQLGEALDHRQVRSPEDWDREASRMGTLRGELNTYVGALHQRRALGESVFQATSRLIGLREVPPIELGMKDVDSVARDCLEAWHGLIDRMTIAAQACGHPANHVWSGCMLRNWSPAGQRGIESDLSAILEACAKLDSIVAKLVPFLGLGSTWSLVHLEFAEKLLQFLATAPRVPLALLLETDWDTAASRLNGWIENGRKRDGLRQRLFARYADRLLELDLDGLVDRYTRARSAWFLPRFFGMRAIRRTLAGVANQREALGAEEIGRDLLDARTLGKLEKLMKGESTAAGLFLGAKWKDGNADWNEVQATREWVAQFRRFASTAAGASVDKAAEFRKLWGRLVVEGHDALQPEGALGKLIAAFSKACADMNQVRTGLEAKLIADAASVWGVPAKQATLACITKRVQTWQASMKLLRAWCNWQEVRQEAIEAGLSALIQSVEAGELAIDCIRPTFDRSFYQNWMERITEQDAALQRFFSPDHEHKIQQFRDTDERYLKLTRDEVQARVASRRPLSSDRVSDASEAGILQRQRKLRRSHLPVRQLFQKIPHLLPRLKPCLLMSPISVAQYLDASHPPFDLVVFDEASQIPVWDAAGAIARGSEVVIVGDPKQLPPTNFFQRADEQDFDDDDVVEEMESILDECLTARLPQMRLRWHYRSRHESLIAFSNHHYYNGELLTFPSPAIERGVVYRHVAGVYDKGKSRTNRAEADAVVAEIARRLKDPALSQRSIGVVTFSMAQQVLIEDLLDELRRTHPQIEPYFSDDAREPVFIKNLENVQGDERDVILFSICYGPDAGGRVSMNFGPINRDGGERRLNVAVTRARHEVLVFATLRAEQIELSRTRSVGVNHLKSFLDYAERGPVAISQAMTLRGDTDFDSPFEQQVCERLRERGYGVHAQVGCSGYRIDLAVVDPETPGRYLLGIECDGANYHSAKTARDRDRLRNEVLRGLGWQLHRVWSSDWWTNADECLAKIEASIEKAKSRPRPSQGIASPPASLGMNAASAPAASAASEAAASAASAESSRSAVPGVAGESAKLAGITAAAVPDSANAGDEADAVDAPLARNESEAETHELPVYKALRISKVYGDPQSFYQPSSDRTIRQLVEKIVRQEGPVLLDVVIRRIAAHWRLGRCGTTIRDRVTAIARATSAKWVQHGESAFLWPSDVDPATYDRFRLPGDSADDQRNMNEIPPEEIAAAGMHVLRQQISMPFDVWVSETARLLGFQRCGPTIRKLAAMGLRLSIAAGRVELTAQSVRLP